MSWRKKQVYSCRESWISGNRQYEFCTVVSEVSSNVGNPVPEKIVLLHNLFDNLQNINEPTKFYF